MKNIIVSFLLAAGLLAGTACSTSRDVRYSEREERDDGTVIKKERRIDDDGITIERKKRDREIGKDEDDKDVSVKVRKDRRDRDRDLDDEPAIIIEKDR